MFLTVTLKYAQPANRCYMALTLIAEISAKFPHSPILHYACRSLLTDYALVLLFLGGETKDYRH